MHSNTGSRDGDEGRNLPEVVGQEVRRSFTPSLSFLAFQCFIYFDKLSFLCCIRHARLS
jgi:hypothetical protein